MFHLTKFKRLIFRQLIDSKSSTYTYLLGCEKTRECILIDTVDIQSERDLKLLKELNLQLVYEVETHGNLKILKILVHADHITGAEKLKKHFPKSKSVISHNSGANIEGVIKVKEGDLIKFGDYAIKVLETPGHTDGCLTYVYNDEMCFTGDSLMIRACGRTDFQQGSPKLLFNSIKNKLYKLPKTCKVFPGHDYKGMLHSTIEEEQLHNPRVFEKQNFEDFEKIMNNLNLKKPDLIDIAVPANLVGGKEIKKE